MDEGLVTHLARFAADQRGGALPDNVINDVKNRILDILGVALAARDEDAAVAARTVAVNQGGTAAASAWGSADKLPPASAAFVNGTYAHALDFDDTHLPSVLHPSAAIVPASVAVAEAVNASGAELATAVAVGDELCIRLGMASYDPEIRNSIFFENGLHATSICGTLGAAASAAMLLGLDAAGIGHAIGASASMAGGIIEANRTGGTVKRIHCGWAAHAGVTAALLAAEGLTGPPTVLEGRFGFYRAYSEGRFNVDALMGGLGVEWEILRMFYKPYPTNHFTHAGIDAAMALVSSGIDLDAIERLELGVPTPVVRTIGEPRELKAAPPTPYAARFSGPFCVAAALVGGGGLGVYLDDFTQETIMDPQRLRLAALVTCVEDEEATAVFPHQFPAVLRATMNDGSEVEHRVTHNRGGPQNPLSDEELATKFRLNANRVLSDGEVKDIEKVARSLEDHSARELAATLQGAGDPL